MPEGMNIRLTEATDAPYLKEWLSDPATRRGFPMESPEEIDDAVERWISFHKWRCSWTAIMHGVPAGIVTLYLQPYKKLAHQSEFGIIVSNRFRGAGVGGHLLRHLMRVSKEQFNLELLHLTVYADNPAIKLYTRFGFREFGRQNCWSKEGEGENKSYVGRVFMERLI